MPRAFTLQVLIATLTIFTTTSYSTASDWEESGFSHRINQSRISIEAHREVSTSTNPNVRAHSVLRTESRTCTETDPGEFTLGLDCSLLAEHAAAAYGCSADQFVELPTEVRTQMPDGSWSAWEPTTLGGCRDMPAGAPTTAQVASILERDLRTVQVAPSVLRVQPDRSWTFVNVDTIVHTDSEPQTLTTSVLGAPIELRLTPVSFAWDFGDGADPLTTTEPGDPYPARTIAHTYTRTGDYQITLTTSWSGQFRVADDPAWHPLSAQATTVTTSAPLQVTQARSILVEDPLP